MNSTPTSKAARPAAAGFDRLARIYRALEFIAFGRDLERARFSFLAELRDCREILVLGEGDGRCVARLVTIAPRAKIHCIDGSPAMLASAAQRLPPEARPRVTFTCANALQLDLPPDRYDAVVTFFFLDCFTSEQTAEIVRRIRPSLRASSVWLFADFVLPRRGWPRLRARIWLYVLYTFFRWETGLGTRALPNSEEQLAAIGLRRETNREFQHGLIRTAVYRLV